MNVLEAGLPCDKEETIEELYDIENIEIEIESENDIQTLAAEQVNIEFYCF